MFITAQVATWQVVGLTAMAFLYVVNVVVFGTVQPLQKISSWTKGPAISPRDENIGKFSLVKEKL